MISSYQLDIAECEVGKERPQLALAHHCVIHFSAKPWNGWCETLRGFLLLCQSLRQWYHHPSIELDPCVNITELPVSWQQTGHMNKKYTFFVCFFVLSQESLGAAPLFSIT